MKTNQIPIVSPVNSRPIHFAGALADFKDGQLCFVIARRFQGHGAVKLLLHEAHVFSDGAAKSGFGYGAGRCWLVSPGTLSGMARSEAKRAASRRNGRKGGRPKN